MPYKNREDRIAYYQRHQKHYMVAFMVSHRNEWNKYQSEYKKRKRLEAGDRGKLHRELMAKYPERYKKQQEAVMYYYENNRERLNAKFRESVRILSDDYIIRTLKRESGLSRSVLKRQPKIIQAKKILILLKREIKNENRN